MTDKMTDNEIIQEATEAIGKNLNAGCYVGDLLRIIKEKKAEIIMRTEEYNDMLEQRNKVEEALEIKTMDVNSLTSERDALEEMVAEQKSEKERLEYVLMAVMHSVDKWLEGGELKQDEANRACTMREKTLKITEKLHKKIDGLQKANQESFVAIEKRKGEIERLNASNNALRKSNEEMFATISKQDAEIERLEENQKSLISHIICGKEIMKEALVDFCEKAKEATFHYYDSEIDSVYKELTESNE